MDGRALLGNLQSRKNIFVPPLNMVPLITPQFFFSLFLFFPFLMD
jgi:hypothetical protein